MKSHKNIGYRDEMTFDGPAIGARISSYRKLNGWTMDEIANRTHGQIKRDVVANIENGRKKDLTVGQLIALAMALGVSPVALMFDVEAPSAPSGVRRASGGPDLSTLEAIHWSTGRFEYGPSSRLPATVITSTALALFDRLARSEIQMTVAQYDVAALLRRRGPDPDSTWTADDELELMRAQERIERATFDWATVRDEVQRLESSHG